MTIDNDSQKNDDNKLIKNSISILNKNTEPNNYEIKLKKEKPKEKKLNIQNKIGNSFLCRWMKTKRGFIDKGFLFTDVTSSVSNTIDNTRNVNVNNSNNNNDNKTGFTPFKGKGIAVGGGNDSISQSNEMDKNNSNNVTVSSSDEINSSDSRMDLNNSGPKLAPST